MSECRRLIVVVSLALALFAPGALAQQSFITFESGQVRPLALSPDHTKLFAVNTPDGRLEIFNVGSEKADSKLSAIQCMRAPARVPGEPGLDGAEI